MRTKAFRIVTPRFPPYGHYQRWFLDVAEFRLLDDVPISVLAVLDDFSGECLHLEAAENASKLQIPQVLDRLAARLKVAKSCVTDHSAYWKPRIQQWLAANSVLWEHPDFTVRRCRADGFFRKLNAEFLAPYRFDTLDALNQGLQSWGTLYHNGHVRVARSRYPFLKELEALT